MESETKHLSCVIRDASGAVHKPGEVVQVIRPVNKLGRLMILVQYSSKLQGYVYPEELSDDSR